MRALSDSILSDALATACKFVPGEAERGMIGLLNRIETWCAVVQTLESSARFLMVMEWSSIGSFSMSRENRRTLFQTVISFTPLESDSDSEWLQKRIQNEKEKPVRKSLASLLS